MPNVPVMSMNEVNKLCSQRGDLIYMESEAEEIYVPDREVRRARGKPELPDPKEGIMGYQKFLHVINRKTVDNSEDHEPFKPEFEQFVRVKQADEEELA